MYRMPSLLAAVAVITAASLGACAPDPSENVPSAVVADDSLAAAALDPAAEEPSGSPVEPIDVAQPMEAPLGAMALDGTIEFVGSKVTRSHECQFHTWEGTLDPGEGTPETASLAFSVDTSSLECDPEESGPMHDRFHEHLLSDEFLSVELYPQATFQSTAIAADPVAPGGYTVTGDLTIRGITREISFPAQVTVQDGAVSAMAEFSLDRRDWELRYDGKPDDLVRDAFVMRIAVSGTR